MFRERGARRTAVITNGYGPHDSPPEAPPETPPEAIVLCHLGSLYPHMQDLTAVWEAVAGFRRSRPGRAVRVRFVGEAPAEVRQQLAEAGIADAVDVTGFLPRREALKLAGESTALLVAGARGTHPSVRGVVPAKVFEYLGTRLPIIYVGNLDSDVAALLARQPLCFCRAAGDAAGVREALEEVARRPRATRRVEAFTRRALAKRLASLLDEVVEEGRR
jgi:glycosyltransferase involved in cell wall biosynthesis